MGSGKSTIGKMLAKKLQLAYIEMDALILEKSQRKTIAEIFEKDGETYFRTIETMIAKALQQQEHAVIATGGGVIMNTINLEYLKQNNGKIFYLATTFKTIQHRLGENTTRPLFQDTETAKKLYELRKPLYQYYADAMIATEYKRRETIVDEIIAKITTI